MTNREQQITYTEDFIDSAYFQQLPQQIESDYFINSDQNGYDFIGDSDKYKNEDSSPTNQDESFEENNVDFLNTKKYKKQPIQNQQKVFKSQEGNINKQLHQQTGIYNNTQQNDNNYIDQLKKEKIQFGYQKKFQQKKTTQLLDEQQNKNSLQRKEIDKYQQSSLIQKQFNDDQPYKQLQNNGISNQMKNKSINQVLYNNQNSNNNNSYLLDKYQNQNCQLQINNDIKSKINTQLYDQKANRINLVNNNIDINRNCNYQEYKTDKNKESVDRNNIIQLSLSQFQQLNQYSNLNQNNKSYLQSYYLNECEEISDEYKSSSVPNSDQLLNEKSSCMFENDSQKYSQIQNSSSFQENNTILQHLKQNSKDNEYIDQINSYIKTEQNNPSIDKIRLYKEFLQKNCYKGVLSYEQVEENENKFYHNRKKSLENKLNLTYQMVFNKKESQKQIQQNKEDYLEQIVESLMLELRMANKVISFLQSQNSFFLEQINLNSTNINESESKQININTQAKDDDLNNNFKNLVQDFQSLKTLSLQQQKRIDILELENKQLQKQNIILEQELKLKDLNQQEQTKSYQFDKQNLINELNILKQEFMDIKIQFSNDLNRIKVNQIKEYQDLELKAKQQIQKKDDYILQLNLIINQLKLK